MKFTKYTNGPYWAYQVGVSTEWFASTHIERFGEHGIRLSPYGTIHLDEIVVFLPTWARPA